MNHELKLENYFWPILGLLLFSLPMAGHAEVVFAPVPGTSLLLGSGYNSLTGASGAECVKVHPLVTLASTNAEILGQQQAENHGQDEIKCTPTGQCVSFRLSQVTTAKQLRESLGVDANASFGLGPFSGDLSAKYYNDNKFSSNSIYIVVNVKITNTSERMMTLELTDFARALLEQNRLDEFLDNCGDTFIGGRTTGGEFTAIIRIETSSVENKKQVEAKLSASGIGWNASAAVSNALTEIRQSNNITIEMFKKGGVGALPNHANIEEVFEFARRLPIALQSNANPAIYLLTAMDYKTVANRPRGNTVLIRQHRALNEIAKLRDQAYELWGNTQFILLNPDQFQKPDLDSLRTSQAEVTRVIDSLYESAERCEEAPTECRLPDVQIPQIQFPDRIEKKKEPVEKKKPAAPVPPKPKDDPAKKYVIERYAELLNRHPDPVGLEHWCNVYGPRENRTAVDDGIRGSDEYFVKKCYRDSLYRWPDHGGFQYWCSELPHRGRCGVKEGISNSDEAFVQQCYKTHLGRQAEPEGLRHWMGVLQRDGRGHVESCIFNSEEARRRR